MSRRLTAALLGAFSICTAFGQTWTRINNLPAHFYPGNILLLKDGTVMAQDSDNDDWWKLTPDLTGNYINGTWSELPTTPGYGPLYYASQVMTDGRVFTMGGEYNLGSSEVWQNQGYIYNPMKNTWTKQSAPNGWTNMGDTGSVVLPNGMILLPRPVQLPGSALQPRQQHLHCALRHRKGGPER